MEEFLIAFGAVLMAMALLWAFLRLLLYDFGQPPVPAYKDPAWSPEELERLTHETHLVP